MFCACTLSVSASRNIDGFKAPHQLKLGLPSLRDAHRLDALLSACGIVKAQESLVRLRPLDVDVALSILAFCENLESEA
jgi:hypothetical protein